MNLATRFCGTGTDGGDGRTGDRHRRRQVSRWPRMLLRHALSVPTIKFASPQIGVNGQGDAPGGMAQKPRRRSRRRS